ncbi:MAG: selenocysteine-specific translation elongation factor [Desulfomonilaceae bacterium]
MNRVILGTAGHIDHGKTELVRALTGIDTDRLKEEKQRGISIELGFAFLDLGDDVRIGIVDVPGHEKFVRQMVAGSGGIDIAALVVALDEGVMPQTTEHLDILKLLGIRLGLVVLTKLDLVDDELALLAEEDVKELVKDSFLEDAPMMRVSSRTGEGIPELRQILTKLAKQVQERPIHGLLRLPVDRIFSLKGHGTVVTGTLISGSIAIGDEVEILPGGTRTSVRGLESHNRREDRAFPGERVAANLRGLEQSGIQRGEVVVHPGQFKPSSIIDVKLTVLPRAPIPLRSGRKVRMHHFTSEVEARVILPDMAELESGRSAMAQLRTSSPIVPSAGDRFVIRALSPSVTLGGGTILNPRGIKLRARTAKSLSELDVEDDLSIIAALVRSSGLTGVAKNELIGLSGFTAKRLDKALISLLNSHTVIRFDPSENRLIHRDFVELVQKKITNHLNSFHVDQPLKQGISKQELRSAVPGGDKLFKIVLDALVSNNQAVDQGDTVRLASHQVKLKDEEKDLKDRLLKMISQGRHSPPLLKEIIESIKGDPKQIRTFLGILEKEGKLIRVKEDLYFSEAFVSDVKRKLAEFIAREGGITPSRFNEITGSSRKYNIPLLEYFDRERFTIRVGDQRVLRGSGNSGAGGKAE